MKTENTKENDRTVRIIYPLLFIAALVPLIVHMKAIPLTGILTSFSENSQNIDYDLYSYYKSTALYIAAIGCIIAVFFKRSVIKFSEHREYYIAIATFVVACLASTLVSDYKDIALRGFPNRYEGLYTLLAYIIILISSMRLIGNEKSVIMISKALCIGATLVGLIGLGQTLGFDVFKTSIGESLILPGNFIGQVDFNLNNTDNQVSSTLYHYNYVGSYMAMLVPFTLTLFIHIKGRLPKVLLGALTMLLLINLFGSTSRAGFVGTVGAVLLYLIISSRNLLSHRRHIIIGFIAVLVSLVAINFISDGFATKRILSLQKEIKSIFFSSERSVSSAPFALKMNGYEAIVTIKGTQLNIIFNESELRFLDKDGVDIPYELAEDRSSVVFNDKRYSDIKVEFITLNKKPVVSVISGNISIFYEVTSQGLELVNSRAEKLDINQIENVDSWGFEGLERLGSARGYIWSRSIPLIKDTILLGHGPDTFALYFPQYDISGKYIAYDDMWVTVDKPHNFYLQTVINTGLLSLIALLFIFLKYIISSWVLYRKSENDNNLKTIGKATYLGVIGYLVAAFFNDSVISVAPVFWVLLGLGISINSLIKVKPIKTT